MNPSEKLQELFLKFPGIGPKQAARFVYFLMREKNNYKQDLARNIEALKDSSNICEKCLRVFSKYNNQKDSSICDICANSMRDKKSLMIVVKELDIDAIEKTKFYNGKYFVLGNLLPFLTEKPSEVINIRELVNLIHNDLQKEEKTENLEEIIFALPATDEGENTINYLKKTLAQIVGIENVRMSTLARGLSSGLDIEYVDKNTFKEAFEHRG
ncbi:Recombination protein RecR [bioreactor metagenome]|uniref:Recombination protein RecR n=1 Tax=bioreactor metagenome TaxID=1076179 RepID=A0A644T627_9ZZZZ|nr:toprim domain-containing protein [Candidatus Elulimicrobiales bacterium]